MTAADGYHGDYSYASIDTTPDAGHGPGAAGKPTSSLVACSPRSTLKLTVRRFRGRAITRIKVYVDHRLVLTRRGRSLHVVSVPGLAGRGRHRIRIAVYTRRGFARAITRTVYGCGHRTGRRRGR
jgi:hypothetical protein